MPEKQFRAEDAIALCVIDIANALVRQSEPVLEEAGLTAPQWSVLLNVARDANFVDGDIRQHSDGACVFSSEIAAARGLSRPHISATVTELLKKGLIIQEDDPTDRRRKRLSPTAAGLAVLGRLQPQRQAVNDMLLSDLSEHQRQQLLDTLRAVRSRARLGEPPRMVHEMQQAC